MTESLEREIRTLRELYWSDRDPDGRVFATLADAYRRSGEIRQALELLEEGRERLPEFPSGHVVAARLYCDAGMMEEASLAARRALELDEENVEALRSLARSVEARGEALEAARLRSRATELESTRAGRAAETPAGEEPEALAPHEEEPVALDALGPDEPAEPQDGREEEPVFSLDELAPDEEEPVALDALAPDEPAEPQDALEEEPVFSLDELAPDEEEPVALDALAPDEPAEPQDVLEEEPVFSLDELAPEEEEPVALDALAPGEPAEPGDAGEESGPESSEQETPSPSVSPGDGSRPLPTGEADGEPSPHDPLPTRTLADLYARQGLTERALSVYRRLLLVTPGDVELQRRIEALTAGEADEHETGDAGARESAEGEASEGAAIAELGLDRDEQSSGSDLDTPFAWTDATETREPSDEGSPISDYFSRMLAWRGGESADGGEAGP